MATKKTTQYYGLDGRADIRFDTEEEATAFRTRCDAKYGKGGGYTTDKKVADANRAEKAKRDKQKDKDRAERWDKMRAGTIAPDGVTTAGAGKTVPASKD